jgi:non-specific serine/threonine protein kinase
LENISADVLLIEPLLEDRNGIRWIEDLATEFPHIRILIVSWQPSPAILRDDMKGRNAKQKVERIQRSLADFSNPATRDESLFLRQHDYWIIRYHGVAAFLKSTRGLYYLAVMLRQPGREFHVLELLAGAIDVSNPAAAVATNGRVRRGLYAAIPVLDAKAKAQLKSRLNDLRQELNEAERFNDFQRKTQAQNELQAIAEYLASAVGIGGRDRKTSSDAERARSAVTKCIRKAIEKIGDAIPSLGWHLASRIQTGYFCSYNPHADRRVTWKF